MTKEERLQALRVNLTNWNFEVDTHFTMTREDANLLTDILLALEGGYKLCKVADIFDFHEPPKYVTNAEKFEEVFGFRPQIIRGGAPSCLGIPCPEDRTEDADSCAGCQYKTFWNDAYKGDKE